LDIKKLKEEYRIRQWSVVVAECQRSGMPVRAWCESQGISRSTYNFWQRRVREAALAGVPAVREPAEGVVPADAAPTQFVRISPEGPTPACGVAMAVRIGAAECEIMNGADVDVIERAILALGKIC
jgi:hypothetical protein